MPFFLRILVKKIELNMGIIKNLFNDDRGARVEAQIERLSRMQAELSVKSTPGDDAFKLITGTGLTPPPKKNVRPTVEELLTMGFAGNTVTHSVIKKVAEVAAQIRWLVQIQDGGGNWMDEEGEVQAIIDQPNAGTTGNEFRINAMTYLMGTGNVYFKTNSGTKGSSIVSFSDDKTKIEIELLPSNLVNIVVNSDNTIKTFDYLRNGSTETVEHLTPEQVEHVKFLDPTLEGHTSHLGISPLVACWNILKASNNLAVADASMLKNKGVLGIISNKGGVDVMTEKEREEMQDATDGVLGGPENYAKTLVSGTPIDYTNIGMSSSDLQMIQGGIYKDRVICTAFGVHSAMFNDNENSTLDNMKVAERKLYNDSAIPNNDVLLRAFEQGIIPKYEERTGKRYRIIQDTSGIAALQVDGGAKAEKDAKNTASIISIMESNMPESMKMMMLVDTYGLEEGEVKIALDEQAKKAEENQAKADAIAAPGAVKKEVEPIKEEENEEE